MTDIEARLSELSPERRALLDAGLRLRQGTGAVAAPADAVEALPDRPLSFSVFFFSDSGRRPGQEAYRLVLDAAAYADTHDFEAIWFPERHFNDFGGLYANPAVLAAAVAATTRRIRIRGGSVVVPLHHPVRVAEEWAMVDNLSGGRVDIAAASGWVPEDFALSGADFAERRQETFSRLETIRALWRGESVAIGADLGRAPRLRSFPRPVQPELPVWITTAGTRETWLRAADNGYNVLTGLTQSTIDEVAEHIRAYRARRGAAGHADAGRVTLMMHTFIGGSDAEVRSAVRDPLVRYLESHLDIYKSMPSVRENLPVDPESFSDDDRAALAQFAFERYFTANGLFGTPQSCLPMIARLQAAGVDEVGCLVDFGLPDDAVLNGLDGVDELRRSVVAAAEARMPAGADR